MSVKLFLNKLMKDIKKVESKSYTIINKGKATNVKFVFAELPNDMKMLAFLAGECWIYDNLVW